MCVCVRVCAPVDPVAFVGVAVRVHADALASRTLLKLMFSSCGTNSPRLLFALKLPNLYHAARMSTLAKSARGTPVDPVAFVGVAVGIHADALAVPAPAFPLALVWGSEIGVQVLGFRIWCLGFGV